MKGKEDLKGDEGEMLEEKPRVVENVHFRFSPDFQRLINESRRRFIKLA